MGKAKKTRFKTGEGKSQGKKGGVLKREKGTGQGQHTRPSKLGAAEQGFSRTNWRGAAPRDRISAQSNKPPSKQDLLPAGG